MSQPNETAAALNLGSLAGLAALTGLPIDKILELIRAILELVELFRKGTGEPETMAAMAKAQEIALQLDAPTVHGTDGFSAAEPMRPGVEDELAAAYGEVFPGEAFDPATIITLVTAIIGIFQGCRQSRAATARSIANKDRRARVATFRAIRQEFPDKTRRECRALVDEVLERAARRPDLVDELQDDAEALCEV